MKAGKKLLMWGILLLAAQGVLAALPWQEVWPRNGQMVFEVRLASSGLVVGRNEQRWQHDGRKWSLRSTAEPTGVAALFSQTRTAQESRGVFIPQGMQPLEFRTEKNGQPRDSAVFDHSARRVVLGNGQTHSITAPSIDLLALFYQVGAYDPANLPSTIFLATGHTAGEYALVAGKPEMLETPLGERFARRLSVFPVGRPDNDERIDIWVDTPTRLPVRIRFRDREGGVFEKRLVKWSPGGGR